MPKKNSELQLAAMREQLPDHQPITVDMLAALLHDLSAEGHGDRHILLAGGLAVAGDVTLIHPALDHSAVLALKTVTPYA